MKNELTKEEQDLMLVVKNEWLERAYNPPKTDKVKIKKAVEDLYELCNLKKPEVLIVDSPLGVQFAANSVRSSVRSSVRDSVVSSVRDSVWDSVVSSVRDSVRDSVWDSKLEWFDFSYYGNYGDYGWTAFYDYFTKINILNDKKFNKWNKIIQSGIYELVVFEKLAIVSVQPKKIYWEELRSRRVMHNENGAAVEWEDGFKVYSLWGVRFDEKLYKKVISKKMSFKAIMSLKNMEQRMVALKLMDAEKLLKSAKAKLLDKSERGNELYLIKGIFSQDAYFLKYSCPSTNRVYVSGIEPNFAKENSSADKCQAWKHNLTIEQYNLLNVES